MRGADWRTGTPDPSIDRSRVEQTSMGMCVTSRSVLMLLIQPAAGRQTARLAFLVPVDSHGGVLDLEMALQLALDCAHDHAGLGVVRGPDVHRRQRAARRDRPHMDMANRSHARHMLQQMTLDFLRRGTIGRTFEQDVQRSGGQLPCAPQDQQRNEDLVCWWRCKVKPSRYAITSRLNPGRTLTPTRS